MQTLAASTNGMRHRELREACKVRAASFCDALATLLREERVLKTQGGMYIMRPE